MRTFAPGKKLECAKANPIPVVPPLINATSWSLFILDLLILERSVHIG